MFVDWSSDIFRGPRVLGSHAITVRLFLVVADRLWLCHALLLTPYFSFLFHHELSVWSSFWRLLELKHASYQHLNSSLADVMKIDGTAFESEHPVSCFEVAVQSHLKYT